MSAYEIYQLWMEKLDPEDTYYKELAAIKENDAEITDRFYQEIAFGTAGQERIGRIMDAFRHGSPEEMTFSPAVQKSQTEEMVFSPAVQKSQTDGSWFAMRPSGTEPKIKFYYYSVSEKKGESNQACKCIRTIRKVMLYGGMILQLINGLSGHSHVPRGWLWPVYFVCFILIFPRS